MVVRLGPYNLLSGVMGALHKTINFPHQDHYILQYPQAQSQNLYSHHKKMTTDHPIQNQQAHFHHTFLLLDIYYCFITTFRIKLGIPFLLNLMLFNFFHIFLSNHLFFTNASINNSFLLLFIYKSKSILHINGPMIGVRD